MDIKSVILKHGMQIQQVAQAMGMKQSSLSAIIAGNPTAKTLKSIAKTIGCPVIEFFLFFLPEDYDIQALIARKKTEDLSMSTQQQEVTRIEKESSLGVLVCPKCGAGIKIKVEEEKHDVEA